MKFKHLPVFIVLIFNVDLKNLDKLENIALAKQQKSEL